ncbi:MAG: hypothetical protein U1E28_04080 [Beijerinckiaceae bacterium]
MRDLLIAMCQGGIYDHLGGGFARYSTDAEWRVPHFEKMLYDNAQILELLALAHADAPHPLFAERARETVGWLMREMRTDAIDGVAFAFAAAQDADQEGEEGLFYTWSEQEIREVLGAGADAFIAAYDVRPGGNWEGKNVLRRVGPPGDAASERALARSRALLFARREKREKPALDDKLLVDWNGLMIRALVRAAAVFGEPAWLDAAQTVWRHVNSIARDDDGRLAHAWRARVTASGQLDDYAAFGLATLALFEATGQRAYFDEAKKLALETIELFGDSDGSLFLTASDASDVPVARPRHGRDNATPAGVGMAAELFARLHHLTGKARWRETTERLVRAFSGGGAALALSPTLLAASDLLEHARVTVVAGDEQSGSVALLHAALTSPDPAVCVLRAGDDWPEGSPAHGRTPVDGKAAAYVCENLVCGLPTTEVAGLARALKAAG